MDRDSIKIIGAGLAGCEAAWQLANRGIKVILFEMRDGDKSTAAHHTDKCAELVCSNSFRNDEVTSAIGLLHEEMRRCNSLIMEAADKTKVPAGGALAMDRVLFAEYVEQAIKTHSNITLIREETLKLPEANESLCIVATGPLTTADLTADILKYTGEDQLAFFDAIAPIIHKDSIDFDIAWFQSRYDKEGPAGTGKDYINCPFEKDEYYNFIAALLAAEKTEFKEWEKNTPYFNGCLPIEVMAERGKDTLLFGPMKPVGLTNPRTGKRAHAVVQLRQDNLLGTLYNMVGFQTKLKYAAQKDIFQMIPGLQNAEFARLGGLHRNTFINSPSQLDSTLRLNNAPHIRFAGQITGVEGYVESAAIGLLTGRFASSEIKGEDFSMPSQETALGALLSHITINAATDTFQPMNINFGLFPQITGRMNKQERQKMYSDRALEKLKEWI